MSNFNKVILLGRLTRDPVLKYLQNQTAICEFGLVTNRKYKTASGEVREEATFVDCTLFGKGAEVFNQYMSKGKSAHIEGRLKFDSWEDKNGGGKRSKLSVLVENFQFIGGGQNNGNQDAGGSQQPAPDDSANDQQFNDDDIPF